jgi:hypothetical protein
MMSCSKLSEPRRVSSQMERTNDIWVGAMLSLARLVVAPPFCSGATIFMKNLWSARFLQAGCCVGVNWALLKSIRSRLGTGPRSMMRVAPGKPQKGLSIQVLNFYQVSCQAVEPFMSSRTRVAKPGSDCVKR